MTRWEDAAFTQEKLLGTIKHNPLFRDYIDGFQDHAYPEFEQFIMRTLHERELQHAEPMYVSMEVTELWDYARDSFQPEPLHPWDLPLNICFALLPKPLFMRDVNNVLINFRALSWIPAGSSKNMGWGKPDETPDGVWYTLWSYIDDGNDDFYRNALGTDEREAWEALGEWSILFSGFLPFGMVEDYEMMAFRDTKEGDDTIVGLDQAVKVRRATWLLLQSFWRLSRQIVPVRSRLPRQLRRDRLRHDRSEEVTVITLRRSSEHSDDDWEPTRSIGEDFHYINRGGWRNQYYRSLGPCYLDDGQINPESHRQIYILPFLKGNLDAPLKNPQRVFEFVR